MPPLRYPPPSPAGETRIEGAFDAPVVRHVEPPPGGVVEIGVLAVVDLAKMKPPIAVEIDGHAVAGCDGGWLPAGGQEKGQTAQRESSCKTHVLAFHSKKSSDVLLENKEDEYGDNREGSQFVP